jgi:C-terminal processing protease CtpA/Prc
LAAAVLTLFGIGVGSYTLSTAVRQSNQQEKIHAEVKRQAEQAQREARVEAKRQAEQAQQEAQAEAKRQAEQVQQEAQAEAKRQAEQAQQEGQAEAKRQAEKENSALSSAWIGVRIHAVTDEIAEGLNIKPPRGALVVGLENGPAKAGGILVGDVLLKFDGHDIKEMRDLPLMVTGTAIGQRVEIVLSRRSNKETHTVTIGPLNDGR